MDELMTQVFSIPWEVWAILILALVAKPILSLWEKSRLASSKIEDIDTMDGEEFEKYLEALFGKLGYRVKRTRYVGDYGADLVVSKKGVKTVVQAKRYKNKVGISAVQEAVAAKGYYRCKKALVVSNNYYTKAAIELAQCNDVELWDRDQLMKAIRKHKNKKVSKNAQEESLEVSSVCLMCGQPVSEEVKQYCLDNSSRFQGRVYCLHHQKHIEKN